MGGGETRRKGGVNAAPVSYALYRRPGAASYTRVKQYAPAKLFAATGELPEDASGYLAVPFSPSQACPVALIEPDETARVPLKLPEKAFEETDKTAEPASAADETAERAAYAQAFGEVKRLLAGGTLQKAVLSRRLVYENPPALSPTELFLRACALRPDCFVALWHTPDTGTWLTATPEPLLLSESGTLWRTVALAGTQPVTDGAEPVWDTKNSEEQALVARYVAATLAPLAAEMRETDTRTVRAGNVQHLRTDFVFRLAPHTAPLAIASALHPTPAVCGLPQKEAMEALLKLERSPRRYYAGYSGPYALDGETALYMSLRCMEYVQDHATLYAGGGVLAESREEEEWEETRHKLRTMQLVLGL